jgi:hypothetical protein
MPKGGKKPPTAEEIAEMLGVAPEKTFKVDHEGMGKVSTEHRVEAFSAGAAPPFLLRGSTAPLLLFLPGSRMRWKQSDHSPQSIVWEPPHRHA